MKSQKSKKISKSNNKSHTKKKSIKKSKVKYSKNASKKGGSNMNDVDIDEIGDVSDALDLNLKDTDLEHFGSGQNRGIFDSLKVNEAGANSQRQDMPQLKCVIL